MKKNDKIYSQIAKELSDEELVNEIIRSEYLSAEDQEKANKEFLHIRKLQLDQMTEQEKLRGYILQMKYAQKAYFKRGQYAKEFSFSNQLAHYLKIAGLSKEKLAKDLSFPLDRLDQILERSERPDVELMYRLEKHSSDELPAYHWWRLYAVELEHIIRTDSKARLDEGKKVSDTLKLSA